MPRRRLVFVVLIGAVAFVAAAIAARYLWHEPQVGKTVRSTGKALIGGPFTLTDQTGKQRTDKDFRGRLLLVFFGFTSCPDVCPTSLQKVSTALEKLGGDADKLRVAFITIDPERDTVERMKRYHEAFDPRIVMLTGTPKQIAKVAKEYRVYYAKRKQGDGPDDYTMDHSAFLYLMDRDGQYVAHYAPNIPADKLAAAVRKHF